MKNWSHISNENLHSLTLNAAKDEKSATLVLLEHLAEVDRRRLYAEKGFPSLWIYVNEFLGYSESQTTERVSAMRLMVKIPEVKKELEEGKITLTSAAKLATHVRREKTGTTETLDLLTSISGKTTREAEQFLAKNATVEYQMEKFKAITSETTRIIIDVDQEFLSLMNRVRELKGHPGSSTQELLKTSMKNLIEKSAPRKTEFKTNTMNSIQRNFDQPKNNPQFNTIGHINSNSHINSKSVESALRAREVEKKSNSRYIPHSLRNEIRIRSGDQCEYIDPESKRRCTCKTRLELDHIIPFMLGGQSTLENLRHYCPAHNRFAAIQQFGYEHMKPFLKN